MLALQCQKWRGGTQFLRGGTAHHWLLPCILLG